MNAAWKVYEQCGIEFEPWAKWPQSGKPKNKPAGSKVQRCWKRHGAVQAKWKHAVARKK